MDTPLPSDKRRLSKEAFSGTEKTRSLDFAKVASTDQTPGWYSPSAANHMNPVMDATVLERVHGMPGKWENLEYLPFGELFDLGHHFVFQAADGPSNDIWYMALGFYKGSGVEGWPCQKLTSAGHVRFLPLPADCGPERFAIVDLKQ
eukprot:7148672-Pyramimonas_sp.AAC.1